MKKLELTIVGSFLFICAGFPIFQAASEIAEGNPPHFLQLFKQKPTKANLHGWDESAKNKSIFAKHIRPFAIQWRYNLLGELDHKCLKGEENWLFFAPDVEYLVYPSYKNYRFYKDTYDTLINDKPINPRNPFFAIVHFKKELEARGIQMVLVPVPGKPSIYPEKLRKGIKEVQESPTHLLINELRAAGVHVVDLYAPLLAAKKAGAEELYLQRDTHWTPAGVDVVSTEIANYLTKMGYGKSTSDTNRYTIVNKPVKRWGDISEMTKLPERLTEWDSQAVVAKQVLDLETGKPYDVGDTISSDILWLGDSFSRIYHTDAPKSAGIIAHTAEKLGRPFTTIVNDGGASTVVRQILMRKLSKLTGKKVVVWEFVERDIRFGKDGWDLMDLPL